MKEEVREYLKQNANNYMESSFYGGRQVNCNKLCEDLQKEFPGITIEELREAIPAVLSLAE